MRHFHLLPFSQGRAVRDDFCPGSLQTPVGESLRYDLVRVCGGDESKILWGPKDGGTTFACGQGFGEGSLEVMAVKPQVET